MICYNIVFSKGHGDVIYANIFALLAICAGNSPVKSPRKGKWRGALMFSLICAWIHAWVNNGEAGDLRRHRVYYDVTVLWWVILPMPSMLII